MYFLAANIAAVIPAATAPPLLATLPILLANDEAAPPVSLNAVLRAFVAFAPLFISFAALFTLFFTLLRPLSRPLSSTFVPMFTSLSFAILL